MSEPTSSRAMRSREKMLRAATDLMVEMGPRAVTVDAVADRSGVAKSTLYRHWSSRDEMVIDVVRCNVPDIPAPDLSGGFAAALRQYIGDAAAALADPEWSRIIPAMLSLRTAMPELAAVVESDQASKTVVLESILDVGVAEGRLPAGFDSNDVAKLLLGPLVFTAMIGDHGRLAWLADEVVDRFLASSRPSDR